MMEENSTCQILFIFYLSTSKYKDQKTKKLCYGDLENSYILFLITLI